MRIFTGSKNLQTPDDGSGGGVNMATGLPFAPNVQTTSPSSTTTSVAPTAGYLQALSGVQQGGQDQAAAVQAQSDAEARAEQVRQNVREGYGPYAGISDPNQAAPTPQMGRVGGLPVPIPGAPEDEPDPFETKRAVGQAARDAAYQQEMQRQAAAHDARIEQAHADLDQRYKAAAAAAAQPGTWENQDAEKKANTRAAIWMSALGAGLSGGDNKAIEYINDQIKQETAARSARSERLFKLAEMSKGVLADAYKERAEDLSNSQLHQAALQKGITDQAEQYAKTMLAPNQQAAAQEKIAKLQAESNKTLADLHNNLATKTEAQSGHTVTTQGLGGKGQGRLPSANDVIETATAEEQAKTAERLDHNMKFAPTPDEIRQVQNNERAFIAQAKQESEGNGWSNLLNRGARATDLMPEGIFPKTMKQETRDWIRDQTDLAHAQATKFYGGMGWMTNPENYQHVMAQRSPQMGDTEDDIRHKAEHTISQARTVNKRLAEVSKAGLAEESRGDPMQVQTAQVKPASPRVAPPQTESIPQLIARGKAAKQAGNMAEAKKIHDQITSQLRAAPEAAQ